MAQSTPGKAYTVSCILIFFHPKDSELFAALQVLDKGLWISSTIRFIILVENFGSSINDKPEEGEKKAGERAVGKPVVINTDSCSKMEILEMESFGAISQSYQHSLGA